MNFILRIERHLPAAFVSLAFIVAYCFFYLNTSALLADADSTWHIASGYKIIELGRIPATDPWSFSAGGQEWYLLSWLWDILLALLDMLGGTLLLFGFCITAMALAMAALTYTLLKRDGVGTDAIIFTMMIATMAMLSFVNIRSQLGSVFLIIAFQHVLHVSRSDASGKRLYMLALLMLVWVNIHGNFFIGFTLLAAHGLEAYLLNNQMRLRRLKICTMGCLVAMSINPYGLDVINGVVGTLGSIMKSHIAEWQPFDISLSHGAAAWAIMLILVGGFTNNRVPLADKIIAALWTLGMLIAIRNVIICVLVSAPLMAISVQDMMAKFDHLRVRRGDIQEKLKLPGMRFKWLIFAIVTPLLTMSLIEYARGEKGYERPVEKNSGPAIEALMQYCAGKHFLTDYDYGGRIIYQTKGLCQVFVDGRAGTAYPEQVLMDYIRFMDLDPSWNTLVDSYKLDGILTSNDTAFAIAYADGQYRDHWREVYRDKVASIYLRK